MNTKKVAILFATLTFSLSGCVESKKQAEAPEVPVEPSTREKPPVDPNALTEVANFLSENGPFFISTVDGDQPRVRPFDFVMVFEGKLCFSTRAGKEVLKQLKVNPWMEICAVNKTDQASWIRVRGKGRVLDSPAAKEKAFELSPGVANIYKKTDNPQFTIICLEEGEVSFNSFTGKSRIVSF